MDEPCFTEIHANEFCEIQVRACCRLFPGHPKSFDELEGEKAGTFARQLRGWLIEHRYEGRVMIERWDYHVDHEVRTFSVQWDGQEGHAHAWAGEAFRSGMDADTVAALVQCDPGAIRNTWGIVAPPSSDMVQGIERDIDERARAKRLDQAQVRRK